MEAIRYSLKVEEFEWIWCNAHRYTKSTQTPQLLENTLSFVRVMIWVPSEIIHFTTPLGNLTLDCRYWV